MLCFLFFIQLTNRILIAYPKAQESWPQFLWKKRWPSWTKKKLAAILKKREEGLPPSFFSKMQDLNIFVVFLLCLIAAMTACIESIMVSSLTIMCLWLQRWWVPTVGLISLSYLLLYLLLAAYKHADGKKIDGRRVLVDVERGRTVKGWRPRRLGKRSQIFFIVFHLLCSYKCKIW